MIVKHPSMHYSTFSPLMLLDLNSFENLANTLAWYCTMHNGDQRTWIGTKR
jgi:hypothetical protein